VEKETIIFRRNPFQRHMRDAIQKNKRITAIFGGWGSGKTHQAALYHIIQRQLYGNPNCLHLIAANTYSQLYDSTLRPLFYWLNKLCISHEPKEIPQTHKPFSIFLHDGDKWVEFLVRSMENINTISGLTLGSAWGDEMWGTERWTFDLIDSRLRDMQSKYLQFVITSNTDEPSHWLYTDIVQKHEFNIKPTKGLFPRDLIEIVYGTTFDNQKNLPPNYIEGLATSLDPKLYQRFVECKWVSLVSGKMFYQFDRELNLRELKFDHNLPLLISSDFNVDPMCWSVIQQHKDELHFIDQIKITGGADTGIACAEVINRYPWCTQFHWFGDASGRSNSTKSKYSDYEIIEGYFREAGKVVTMHIPFSNPSVRDSSNSVNSMLKNNKGKARLFFDKNRCPDIILSVEGCNYKPGTLEKDESKDRDPKSRIKTHFGDTVRYIVEELFSLRPKIESRQYSPEDDE
jgi:hypothetical protein